MILLSKVSVEGFASTGVLTQRKATDGYQKTCYRGCGADNQIVKIDSCSIREAVRHFLSLGAR
jgi:hypothetical protein